MKRLSKVSMVGVEKYEIRKRKNSEEGQYFREV